MEKCFLEKQVIFITTTGGANIETIRQYIERQREK
ncbi:hypothetical protein [uncultured Methanobrevibacter sp.]